MREIWILGLCSVLVSWQIMPVPDAIAALPPLSKETLVKSSSHIVVAKVRSISQVEVPISLGNNAGTNYNYEAIVEILIVEKSTQSKPPAKSSQLSPGKVIQVKYWKAHKRPNIWVGDGGQRPGLTANTTVRLFIKQDAQGKFQLQDPNGSELLPAK
jgi:hypothetical protein